MTKGTRPKYDSKRAEEQFGFLLNKNYLATGGRSGQVKPSKETVDANRAKAQSLLSNFFGRFRNKREPNVEPAYKPEPGVMYGSLPADYKQTEQRIFEEAADFNKRTKGRTDLDLNLDTSGGPKADVQYGPGKRATDLLERFVGDQLYQNQLSGFSQNLLNQQMASAAERNRQNLETTLAFDRDSPTKQQERQFKAKYGEALLAEAVAKQASAGAEMGGLGTARRFGRG